MEAMSAGVEALLVHRVGPLAADATPVERALTISVDRLDRALAARADAARPSPEQLLRGGASGVLLTCDDGHVSFAEQVLPLIERHRVHAILFVTTAFAAGEHGAYEARLAHALALRGELERYAELREPLKPLGADERERALEELDVPPRAPREDYLDWTALRELAAHPLVTIGAHGRRHTLLSAQRPWVAWGEIAGSRREIGRRLGAAVDWFAYPYGGQSRWTRRLVALAGFRGAFTTEPGAILDGGSRFAWPRVELREEAAS